MRKLFALLLSFVTLASAQTPVDNASEFSFSYRVAGTPTLIGVSAASGTITFPDTNVGSKSSVTLLIFSSPNVSQLYSINNIAVSGAGFSAALGSASVPPQNAGTGSIVLTFAPAVSGTVNGSIQFTLSGPTLNFTYTISLFANGLAPRVVTSYIAPATGDQIAVQSGDSITVPNTPVGAAAGTVNATTLTTFDIANTGTGPATIDSVAISGAAFTLSNLALVPATLNPNGEFRFQINFTPTAAQAYTGTLQVSVGGKLSTYSLRGQGTSSAFTYQLLTASGAQPIQPGGSIALPDTPADGVTNNSITVQVTNTGNMDAVLSSLNATGADFALSNLPILPVTLKANGGSTLFNIVYQPKSPGTSSGRLQLGNDLFNLTGKGLGPLLTYTANVGTGNIALPSSGAIAVPNTMVGGKRTVSVAVTNAGNQTTTISSFSVSGAAFSAVALPALPVSLAPGQAQQFQFVFAPAATGQATGAIAINGQSFTVVAAGDPPPAISAITFSGIQNTTNPLQQPAVGIQLASAYPSDITGILTLTFLSDSFVDDPSIQFATGGRTVPFTIPANTTQAVFGPLGKAAPFQTGTLSGTVNFTAAFMTGAVDITPATPPFRTTVIPAGAPQLRSVRLSTPETTAGTTGVIQLLISGYATTRSISQLAFQFTGAAATNVQTPSLTADVSSAFTSWYANPASKVFGSQFTITISLTIAGDPNALQSISVAASNTQGTSAPVSVALR